MSTEAKAPGPAEASGAKPSRSRSPDHRDSRHRNHHHSHHNPRRATHYPPHHRDERRVRRDDYDDRYRHAPHQHRFSSRDSRNHSRPRYDDFGRERPERRPSRSRSRSRRSQSASSRSSSRSHSSDSSSSNSSRGSNSSSASSIQEDRESPLTKDQRTVFVNQLVQRATSRDLKKYLSSKGFAVNEVILLRDKRTGKHKGCAYVELRKLENVLPCIEQLSNQVPDFQKFPILLKASEAEKNYVALSTITTTTALPGTAAAALSASKTLPPILDANGNPIVSQKVYVGGLNPSVTQEHLLALFGPFGSLLSIQMQMDTVTQTSKGFCFLHFWDPKDANLAIQSMAGQALAGKPLKTGWANQAGGVTSEEFPADAAQKTQAAYSVLKQLNLGQSVALVNGVSTTTTMSGGAATQAMVPQPGTVAAARANLAALVASNVPTGGAAAPVPLVSPPVAPSVSTSTLGDPDATKVGNADHPTRHLLIYNMFDKDQETEPGWEREIKLEFESEATKFGKLERCVVMHKETGGKIYASFCSLEGAKNCSSSLAGRWFDKRQLRVEFVAEQDVPKDE